MGSFFYKGLALVVITLGLMFHYIFSFEIDMSDSVNMITTIGAVAILTLSVFISLKYINQIKTDKATGDLTDDNWDGIGEFNNPLPTGWAITFVATIIWAIWYWVGPVGAPFTYPLNAYSQIGEYNEDVAKAQKEIDEKWANPTQRDLMGMGEGVFLVQCASCHGIDGAGINGKAASFETWGSKEGIIEAIKYGSKGLGYPIESMPPELLNGDEAEAVADYIMHSMRGEAPAAYTSACASCHGEDGKGMDGLSPSLANYGKPDFVIDVLNRGNKKDRIGAMPSFKHMLTPIQKRAVSTYILSLRNAN